MSPPERKTAEELAGRDNRNPECPYCSCKDFRVVKTWWVKSGEKHSSFICRHCGAYEFNAEVRKIIIPI
jgi:hypothetical protein